VLIDVLGLAHQESGKQKNRLSIRKGGYRDPERFLFSGFLPLHIGRLSSSKPPWDFSVPGWQHWLLPQCVLDVFEM
jgi:hypothetical protein